MVSVIVTTSQQNGRLAMRIGWLWLIDDVTRLHIEIDNLN
jgi:hypothetical protein